MVKEYKILLGPPSSLMVGDEGTTLFLAIERRFLQEIRILSYTAADVAERHSDK